MVYFAILIVLAALILLIVKNVSKDEDKIQIQKEKYETLLKQYGVPENHTRIVIAQSKVYNLYNCPAVAWIDGEVVKTAQIYIDNKKVEIK